MNQPAHSDIRSGWVGIDLDGTLAHFDPALIGTGDWTTIGEPIPPMALLARGFIDWGVDVRIFTARMEMHGKDGIDIVTPVQDWTEKHIGVRLPVTNVKDMSCRAIIDDRAVAVEHNTGRTAEWINGRLHVDGREI